MNVLYCVWTVLIYFLYKVSSQCNFPGNLQGQWLRSRDSKTLSFTSPTTVTGFNLESKKQTVDEFTCFIREGSKYVLRSERYNNIVPNTYIYIYICYDMVAVGNKAFYIYEITERTSEISNNERGAVYSDTLTVTLSDICTLTRNDVQYTTLVSNAGLASNDITYCPDILLGSFNYTQQALVSQCPGTATLTACNDRVTISANQTSCSDDYFGYSAGGFLLCTATLQFSTVTYVTLYNKDSTVDGSKSYKFSCLAIEKSGDELLMTQYPTDCELGQSGTSVSSPGFKFTLQPQVLCPIPDPTTTIDPISPSTSAEDDNILIIVGALIGVIVLLALIILIILCIRAKNRKKAKVADSTASPTEKQQNGLHPQNRNQAKSPISSRGVFIHPNNNEGDSTLNSVDENGNHRRSSGDVVIGTKRTEKPPAVVPRLEPSDDKPHANVTQSISRQSAATASSNGTSTHNNLEQTNGKVIKTSSEQNHKSGTKEYGYDMDPKSSNMNTKGNSKSQNSEKDGHGKTDESLNSNINTGQTCGTINETGLYCPLAISSDQNIGAKNDKNQALGDKETTSIITTVPNNANSAPAKSTKGKQKNLDRSTNKGHNGSNFSQNAPTISDEEKKGGVQSGVIIDHASAESPAISASSASIIKNATQISTANSNGKGKNTSIQSSNNELNDFPQNSAMSSNNRSKSDVMNNDSARGTTGTTSAFDTQQTSVTNIKGSKNNPKGSSKHEYNELGFLQNASVISDDKSKSGGVSNYSFKGNDSVDNGMKSTSGSNVPPNTEQSSAKNIKEKQKNSKYSTNKGRDDANPSHNDKDVGANEEIDPNKRKSDADNQSKIQSNSSKNGSLGHIDGIFGNSMTQNVSSSKMQQSKADSIDPSMAKVSANESDRGTDHAPSSRTKFNISDTSIIKNSNGALSQSGTTKTRGTPDSLAQSQESGFYTTDTSDTESTFVTDGAKSKKRKRKKYRKSNKNNTDSINFSGVYQPGASNIIDGLSGKLQTDKNKAVYGTSKRKDGVATKSSRRNKSKATSDSDEIDSETSSDFTITETDLFSPRSLNADGLPISGQEIIDRKESVISSVGPASCALISPKDGVMKKTSVVSVLDDISETKQSKKKSKSKSKKKKK